MTTMSSIRSGTLAIIAAACAAAGAQTSTPAELLAGYRAQSGAVPSAERGKTLFTTNFGRELGWSCSSCHGADPTRSGKDEVAEKPIAPMAPAFNPERFTDRVKVENAFRLNCRDVVGRECSAGEKADVLSWLLSFKRCGRAARKGAGSGRTLVRGPPSRHTCG